MKYLVEVERPVFLHFLNREASLAAEHQRDETQDLEAINVLTVCHCSGLTVNISQMIEYSAGKPRLMSALISLSQSGILSSTSHDATMTEFVASRQKIYRNVATKYPMYFGDSSSLEKFKITRSNSFSMTNLLRRDILDASDTKLTLIGRRARKEDVEKVVANLGVLQDIAFRYRDDAITRANFEYLSGKGSLTPDALAATGRMFSALYFEHYANQIGAATCTGMTEVGYVEGEEHFPHYDVPVLRGVLAALGWESMAQGLGDLRQQVEVLYHSATHCAFVELLNAFLHACFAVSNSASAASIFGKDDLISRRSTVQNFATHLLRDSTRSSTPAVTLQQFLLDASQTIRIAGGSGSSMSAEFKEAWDANVPPKGRASVLLVTATDTEDEALITGLSAAGFVLSENIDIGQGFAQVYTRGASQQVVHARSSAGSSGASGSELVVSEALAAVGADFAIAVGICFGLRKGDGQSLGDVLVSESVVDYETVREGENETRERGSRQTAGSKLTSAAHIVKRSYASAEHRVQAGLIVSGQKLVDNEGLVSKLKERFPDAIGGEMEGNGLVGACSRAKKEWLVIKGICDWGFKKRGKHQAQAASNAAGFAIKVALYILDAEMKRILR
jgi:nucleoside phosphorylase